MKWYFGGKTVGQMKRKCGVHSKSVSPFRTLNLPIKGFESIEQCLDAYVRRWGEGFFFFLSLYPELYTLLHPIFITISRIRNSLIQTFALNI